MKINNNHKTSLRLLLSLLEDKCRKTVWYKTVRKVLKIHKHSSKIAWKKSLFSALNIEKRINFTIVHVNKPAEYWDDIVFCDETKIMVHHHEEPTEVYRKLYWSSTTSFLLRILAVSFLKALSSCVFSMM